MPVFVAGVVAGFVSAVSASGGEAGDRADAPGAADRTASDAGGAGRLVLRPLLAVEPVPPMPLELVLVREAADGRWQPVGDASASSDEGTVRALPSVDPRVRRFRFTPLPGAEGSVRVRAGTASAQLRLDPSVAGRVQVAVDPPQLVKGPGASAKVTVRVTGARGRPADGPPPKLSVNVGELSAPTRAAPGVWEAVYRPGPARYPEVAVIAAVQPWPHAQSAAFAAGHASLPLSAAIMLPGETRPRVKTTVEIAGTVFGPVRSDRRGRFEVPVVVPPGHGSAKGVSVDRFGNERVTRIDLRLPPTNRASVAVHPTRLVADGAAHAQVAIFVVDRFGRPAVGERPVLEAERGRVTVPVEAGAGLYRAWYVAPEGAGDGRDRLRVALPGDARSRATLEVTLVPGTPAEVRLSDAPELLPAPSAEPARLFARILDAHGAAVPDARVGARAGRGALRVVPGLRGAAEGVGAVGPEDASAEDASAGERALVYQPPGSPEGWEDRLVVTARPAAGEAAVRVAFDAGAQGGALVALDAWDRPVPGAKVTFVPPGRATAARGAPDAEYGTAQEAESGAAQGAAPGTAQGAEPGAGGTLRADAEGRLPLPPGPAALVRVEGGAAQRILLAPGPIGAPLWNGAARAVHTVALMEPLPVDVRAEVVRERGGLLELRWEIRGTSDPEREVVLAVGDAEVLHRRGVGGVELVDAPPGTPVTVTDVASGVSAVTSVPAGSDG